jgi:hypothetical protein
MPRPQQGPARIPMDTASDGTTGAGRREPAPERTSEVLAALAHGNSERVSFGEILLGLRHRAIGFATLIFALPSCLPMPPGIPTICGIALVIIALNLIAMRRRLWLPRAIAGKTVARADIERVVAWATPLMRRLERSCRPRLPVVTESVGKVIVGVVILVLGLVMILPIPFVGNMPPAFAAAVIAIGMTEQDGLIVLIGLAVSVAAIFIASATTWAAIVGIVDYFMR